jgi:predicted HicB family RNase H-like nuclease
VYFLPQTRKQTKKQKRINVGLSDKLHKQAKVISILKEVTLNVYLEEAISESIRHDLGTVKSFRGRK